MEKWDAYLENGQKTSITLTRGQGIPQGLFHLVAEVLVQHSDGDILFVQRSFSKGQYAGYFEATAGGSVLQGETSEDAVIRELAEETGIQSAKPRFLERKVLSDAASLIDRYYLQTTWDKKSIVLQTDETVNFIWLPLEDLDSFIAAHPILPRQLETIRKVQRGEV
ncbi:NUDIX domain-containing protein [Streptococcus sp. H49]|uniref:NUDIX hydrolase n=1 Tax=Streptococcus huangxiaojuni TaxID=3237239 RepID=UPI0034A3B540